MRLSVVEYSILLECSDFLIESQNIPLFKCLSNIYKDQQKIKIRKKDTSEQYHNHLDNFLNFKNFENRSLTCYTDMITPLENYDLYYIFIPDGYKFLYSKTEEDIDFKNIFKMLISNVDKAGEIFEELLDYSYSSNNLYNGIVSKKEIMFYNIPYYYAIRATDKNIHQKLCQYLK